MNKIYTSDVVATYPATLVRQVLAVLGGLGVGLGMVGVGVYGLRDYGLILFLATPFAMGVVAGFILHYGTDEDGLNTGLVVAAMFFTTAAVLLFVAMEGIVCLVLALPLAIAGTVAGAEAGKYFAGTQTRPKNLLLGALLLPISAGVEATMPDDSTARVVLSTIEIDAPPERVWAHVIAFPPLPEPTEWWFKAGLAYPKHASIDGVGVGAVRSCVFSTGPFIEPITAWEPGRRLAFDVSQSPPPLRELTFWNDVHPPHLDGYLRAKRGEFRLIPISGNRTRLEGRTWYELDMSPAWYWESIVDMVIHRIHGRVLDHIKRETERTVTGVNLERWNP